LTSRSPEGPIAKRWWFSKRLAVSNMMKWSIRALYHAYGLDCCTVVPRQTQGGGGFIYSKCGGSCLAIGSSIAAAHVGDSRALLASRNASGELVQSFATSDHKPELQEVCYLLIEWEIST
jgi:hypothetical protein